MSFGIAILTLAWKSAIQCVNNKLKTHLGNPVQTFESLEKMSDFNENAVSELASILKIDKLNRFEVFDISHTAGAYTVGGMIVYEDFGYKKNEYRIYVRSCLYSKKICERKIADFLKGK